MCRIQSQQTRPIDLLPSSSSLLSKSAKQIWPLREIRGQVGGKFEPGESFLNQLVIFSYFYLRDGKAWSFSRARRAILISDFLGQEGSVWAFYAYIRRHELSRKQHTRTHAHAGTHPHATSQSTFIVYAVLAYSLCMFIICISVDVRQWFYLSISVFTYCYGYSFIYLFTYLSIYLPVYKCIYVYGYTHVHKYIYIHTEHEWNNH